MVDVVITTIMMLMVLVISMMLMVALSVRGTEMLSRTRIFVVSQLKQNGRLLLLDSLPGYEDVSVFGLRSRSGPLVMVYPCFTLLGCLFG